MLKRCEFPQCLSEGELIVVDNNDIGILCLEHIKLASIIYDSNDVKAFHRLKCKIKNEKLSRIKQKELMLN